MLISGHHYSCHLQLIFTFWPQAVRVEAEIHPFCCYNDILFQRKSKELSCTQMVELHMTQLVHSCCNQNHFLYAKMVAIAIQPCLREIKLLVCSDTSTNRKLPINELVTWQCLPAVYMLTCIEVTKNNHKRSRACEYSVKEGLWDHSQPASWSVSYKTWFSLEQATLLRTKTQSSLIRSIIFCSGILQQQEVNKLQ